MAMKGRVYPVSVRQGQETICRGGSGKASVYNDRQETACITIETKIGTPTAAIVISDNEAERVRNICYSYRGYAASERLRGSVIMKTAVSCM
jgi:hypothetical protein